LREEAKPLASQLMGNRARLVGREYRDDEATKLAVLLEVVAQELHQSRTATCAIRRLVMAMYRRRRGTRTAAARERVIRGIHQRRAIGTAADQLEILLSKKAAWDLTLGVTKDEASAVREASQWVTRPGDVAVLRETLGELHDERVSLEALLSQAPFTLAALEAAVVAEDVETRAVTLLEVRLALLAQARGRWPVVWPVRSDWRQFLGSRSNARRPRSRVVV
jgi:hypothetical protein